MAKLEAKKGYVFALKDRSAVFYNIIYVADIDDPNRFIEITEAEADKLRQKLEAQENPV